MRAGLGLGFAPWARVSARAGVALPPAPIASVDANGWSAQWAAGTPPTFAPDTAPLRVAVTRQGYDATGAATLHAGLRTFTRRVRQLYPNQASDTAATVAFDDYVYATDSIAGVANNSTETSPKPVAAWVMPDRQLVGNTIDWELIAFHRNMRANRQVACVVVRASDGTASVSQTISATALSNLCEDRNAVEVFKASLDISSLATGLITLNAKVYPWIGASGSVLDSADQSAAREFSPRHFLKNAALLAAPPLAYVASTGNDSGGIASTTAATALASPCLTVAGALAKIAAGFGVVDGARIRILDNVSLGSSLATRAQSVAAVIVERAPGVARSTAIVTLSSAFRARIGVGTLTAPLSEGCILFRDVTLSRTANVPFTGESATQLRVMFWNVDIANNGTAGTWLANSHDYFFGVTISGVNGNLGATTLQHRLMRGLSADLNSAAIEGWVTIGCSIARSSGITYSDPTRGAIHYANGYLDPQIASGAPIAISAVNAGDTISGFVAVQNVIEITSASSAPALRISSDTPQHGHTLHAISAHNLITGYGSVGRSNLFYDNTPGEVRNHRLMRDVGNIYVQLNTKGDVFSADAAHIGQLAYAHGVGCQGNFSMFRTNSGIASSEMQGYPGVGSVIGTSDTVRNDPLFTDYRGTGGSSGTPSAGAGAGTYTLQPGSSARGIVSVLGLAYDLAGIARGSATTHAGAFS